MRGTSAICNAIKVAKRCNLDGLNNIVAAVEKLQNLNRRYRFKEDGASGAATDVICTLSEGLRLRQPFPSATFMGFTYNTNKVSITSGQSTIAGGAETGWVSPARDFWRQQHCQKQHIPCFLTLYHITKMTADRNCGFALWLIHGRKSSWLEVHLRLSGRPNSDAAGHLRDVAIASGARVSSQGL